MVCFDRIDEPLSPSGLQSLCTMPVLKQTARYLLRGAAVLPHFLASVALSELNLDRESGPM